MSRAPTTVPVQSDLFVADAMKGRQQYRSDRLLMQLPLFALNKAPVREERTETWVDGGVTTFVRVTPSHEGLATQWDFDYLMYLQSVIVDRLNRGEPVSPTIRFSIYDCHKFLQRGTGGKDYDAFAASLRRLQGTIVYTNIKTGDRTIDGGFGWLQKFTMSKRELANGKTVLESCEVTLCDWLFRALVEDKKFLSLKPEYLSLERGLDRKLFLIINSFIGNEDSWWVGLDKLRTMSGATSSPAKFAYELRKLIERDDFPVWKLYLSLDSKGPQFGGRIVPPPPNTRSPVYVYVYRRKSNVRAPQLALR